MNTIIEEIKVLSASDSFIENGSFEILAANPELISNTDFSTWTYLSGDISDFVDYSGTVAGTTQVKDIAHGLTTGDLVEIRGGSVGYYDGPIAITKIDSDSYYIALAFSTNETGASWVKIDTFPDGWTGSTNVLTDYVIPGISGGLKFYSETINIWFLQVTLTSNDIVDDATGVCVIDVESLTSGELVIKNGSTIIQTITESGKTTFKFTKESSDVFYVFGSSATTEAIINSISIQNTKIFENWDNFFTNDAIISESIGFVGDKSLSLYEPTGSSVYVQQIIDGTSILDIVNKTVILGFAYKASNEYNLGVEIYYRFNLTGDFTSLQISTNNFDWNYDFIEIFIPSGTTELEIRLGAEDTTLYDDIKLYYIEEEELEKELIIEKDNIKTEIEDDLFTFKADDISMKMWNVSNSGYFNPMNFITENKLYAIRIRYDSDGSSNQYQYLFTNWDNCSRKQTSNTDYINLSFFELSGLLSNMNWYLGRYIYDPEVSESGVYRFSTEKPLILDKSGTVQTYDILNDRLLPALKNVIVQNKLPIYPDNVNLEIESNLLSDISWINNIELIEGTNNGSFKVLDYFIDIYTNRIFLLLVDNNWTYDKTAEREIYVYEIINGSILINQFSYTGRNDINDSLQIGFLHEWETDSLVDGGNIIIQQIYNSAISVFQNRYVVLKYNGSTLEHLESYELPITISYPDGREQDYVASDGKIYPNGTTHNFMFIYNYPNSNSFSLYTDKILGSEYQFSLTNYFTQLTSDGMGWAEKLDLSTHKFPNYLFLSGSAGFTNSTLAAIMKEICVTQDALWYFKYTSANDITLYIRRRAIISGEGTLGINDVSQLSSLVKNINTKLSTITFDDITSSIYANDPYRLKLFRDWYNSKYGGGKQLKSLTMFGLIDLVLGDVTFMDSVPGTKLMIKRLEWKEKEYETDVEMFEIGEDE